MTATKGSDNIGVLPSPLAALRRSIAIAYQVQPWLLMGSVAMIMLGALVDSLYALWLKLLVDGFNQGENRLIYAAALGLAAGIAGSWIIQIAWVRIERIFRFRVRLEFESRVAALQASIPDLEHHERAKVVDRISVLRDGVLQLGMIYGDLFSAIGGVIRIGVVVILLTSVHWWLVALLPFAAPLLFVASWSARTQRAAEEQIAPERRRARYLFSLALSPAEARELRVNGTRQRVANSYAEINERWVLSLGQAIIRGGLAQAVAWATFAAAYIVCVSIVATTGTGTGRASAAILVVMSGGRLSQYLTGTVGSVGSLRMWLDVAQRLLWLERYAGARAMGPAQPAPVTLTNGIAFDNVGFRYPGTDRDVLIDIDLAIPSGTVVALVGENGAGKTTLLKLLCRLYEPTSGSIRVDGCNLNDVAPQSWRGRVTGAHQDFAQFEFTAGESIGVGELARIADQDALARAIERSSSHDLICSLPQGLGTQLGTKWPSGVGLSFGQWQRIAMARAAMPDDPLLVVLDEPTAALDAHAEQVLVQDFLRHTEHAKGTGRITIIVSHRLATASLADQIVVIGQNSILEQGSHAELLAAGGTYADLVKTHEAAYS